jgi:F0F1-type ATP synthase delta subunit
MTNSGFTVESHFEGKDPIVRQIYDRLLKQTDRFGPVVEEPKKTSIHLMNATAFGGVATRRNAIVLTIKSDHKLNSPRVHKTEQVSAHRFHHEVKLTSLTEVDAELLGCKRAQIDGCLGES